MGKRGQEREERREVQMTVDDRVAAVRGLESKGASAMS